MITLDNLGKRYRLDWVFRGLNHRFADKGRYAILGANGSGKSTLMKVLSGHLSPSKGKIQYHVLGKEITVEQIYRHVSYTAPYIDLIEELSLEEAIRFHSGIKPLLPGFDSEAIMETLALPKARHKEIRFFSSGMKQRLKLALAICSDSPVLLLDEPSTNLDQQGVEWYAQLIEKWTGNRLVIIASNDPFDLSICRERLNIMDYKK